MREDSHSMLTQNGKYNGVTLEEMTIADAFVPLSLEPEVQEREATMKVDAVLAKKARMLEKAETAKDAQVVAGQAEQTMQTGGKKEDEVEDTMPSVEESFDEQHLQPTPFPLSGQSSDETSVPFPTPIETPLPNPLPALTDSSHTAVSVPAVKQAGKPFRKDKGLAPRVKRDMAAAHQVREQCRQMCIALFLREQSPIRSLGFTSSIRGEGKTFLSVIAAGELAKDSNEPVTLLECNWDNPGLHDYFHLSPTPGLAEWLRGECSEMAIRHQVDQNLTVIPAGDGRRDAVKLLKQMQQHHLHSLFANRNELLIVDLPPVMASAYGVLAASLVDTLVVVVRASVTPGQVVAETCAQLKDSTVYGLLLNQIQSQVPGWIRQLT